MNSIFKQPDSENPESNQYNLLTRSDMDGLMCAVLLKYLGMVEDVIFTHPNDMQNGHVKVGSNDITANLPYVQGVHLAFDHHTSEEERFFKTPSNYILDPEAPSTARLIYNYFGGEESFPDISTEMMKAVDKADSAKFTKDEILNPTGWVLISFIMDARTGLGRFRDFNISNYQLMVKLIDYCCDHQDANEILELPDVKERVDLYRQHQDRAREQLERCGEVYDNLIVLDLRNEDTIWAINRFVIYALYPECNISMHIMWGKGQKNTVFSVGKSILNTTSNTDVGSLMLEFGGGGHKAAGTCQADNLHADELREELIRRITADG